MCQCKKMEKYEVSGWVGVGERLAMKQAKNTSEAGDHNDVTEIELTTARGSGSLCGSDKTSWALL